MRSDSRRHLPLLTLLCAATLAGAGCGEPHEAVSEEAQAALEWRQFRGPGGLGIAPEADLPRYWGGDRQRNIEWRVPLPGLGNSSPVVSRGRVFLTTSYGPNRSRPRRNVPVERVVVALDAATGKILWETTVFAAPIEERHHLNTPAAATPVADGKAVYAFFGNWLAALDYDGAVLWKKEVDSGYLDESRYANASSPIIAGRAVVVARDDEWGEGANRSWLGAFDRETGEEIWRVRNEDTCCSYATPFLLQRPTGPEILFQTSPYAASYDLETGARLWSLEHTFIQLVPTPVASGDVVVLGGSIHDKGMMAVRLEGGGADTQPNVLWSDFRSAPEMASTLLVDGRLFSVTDKGILYVVDVETGEHLWRHRLDVGNYRSSLVAAGDRLLATSTACVTSVISIERLRVIAENELTESYCDASPAIADGRLILRSKEELFSITKGTAGDDDEEAETEEAEAEEAEAEEA